MGKRLCSLLLVAILVGGMVPVAAAAEDISVTDMDSDVSIAEIGEADDTEEITIDAPEDTEEDAQATEEVVVGEDEETTEQTLELDDAGDPVSVDVVSDLNEVSALIQDNWEDSYYGEITVDPKENQVEMDGEEISLRSELDLTKTEENTVLASATKAENYFDKQPEYEAYTDTEGIVHVSNPYQTCRIILYASQLEEAYGASTVLYLEKYGEYMLQYDTEEQTRLAYEALLPQYGSSNCYLDEVLSSDMLLGTSSTTTKSTSPTQTECYSWGAQYMGLDVLKGQVAEYGLSKNSVTVAVIDTGIDKNHSFFSGRTITGYNFLVTKKRSATNYTDDNGHGTHVAGIIADCTPTNVSIMALRVFNASGSTTSTTIIDNALKYAYEHKAKVINMSLGTEDRSGVWDKTLQTIHNAGIPVVAAAGNYTETNKTLKVNYPASLSTTYAVSAVDSNGTIGSYSCRGSAIDFAAPGTSILGAKAGADVRYDTGTSMAAPHVTAAIAMIYLKHPTYSLTSLEQVLKTYAVDRGTAGKDSKYGYGILCGLGDYYKEDSANLVLKTATLKYKKMQYTGAKRKDPVVQVKSSAGKVLSSSCYKVTYSNNKSVGTATATITGINGCKGTITKTFIIKPKNIKITTLTNKATRKMYIKWSASLGYTGYQIQYATNSSFTKGKHSVKRSGKSRTKTYTKLTRGKRYYVRVRAYKKVGSTIYYGTWSTVRSVKISK